MMDAHATKRLSATLAAHRDAILEHWLDAVHATLRGRMTRAELSKLIASDDDEVPEEHHH